MKVSAWRAARYGVYLRAGGSVTNGGGNDHAAVIDGGDGVVIEGGVSATINNFGTVVATSAPTGPAS